MSASSFEYFPSNFKSHAARFTNHSTIPLKHTVPQRIMFLTPTTSPTEKSVGTPCVIVALNYANCRMTFYSPLEKKKIRPYVSTCPFPNSQQTHGFLLQNSSTANLMFTGPCIIVITEE